MDAARDVNAVGYDNVNCTCMYVCAVRVEADLFSVHGRANSYVSVGSRIDAWEVGKGPMSTSSATPAVLKVKNKVKIKLCPGSGPKPNQN